MEFPYKRFAVIADIHSNLPALEAVLADISTQQCEGILDLGDCVSGPLFPRETAEQLIRLGIVSLRGNHERQLLTTPRTQMGKSDHYAIDRLTKEQMVWLGQRPECLRSGKDILAFHGSPQSDHRYLLETVERGHCRPASISEVEKRLEGVSERLILCGHTHLPRSMRLSDGRLVVNPGSVGLQAYEETYEEGNPDLHQNESGSPHARYALLDGRSGEWNETFRQVEYDWEAEPHRVCRRPST